MTTVTEALVTVLRGYAGVQSIVGNGDSPQTYRIYSLVAPQNAADPCIVIHNAGRVRVSTIAPAGGNGVDNQRARITMFATTLAAAEALSEQVRLALAAAASTNFQATQLLDLDDYDDTTGLYQVVVDYSIWYRH